MTTVNDDEDSAGIIHMTSGVSAFNGEGFVSFRWGSESGQLTPSESAQHGLAAIATAMAAEYDAMVWAELTDPEGLNMSDDVAGGFLQALRKRREAAGD